MVKEREYKNIVYICEVCKREHYSLKNAQDCEKQLPRKSNVFYNGGSWEVGDLVLIRYEEDEDSITWMIGKINNTNIKQHDICPVIVDINGTEIEQSEADISLLDNTNIKNLSMWLTELTNKAVMESI